MPFRSFVTCWAVWHCTNNQSELNMWLQQQCVWHLPKAKREHSCNKVCSFHLVLWLSKNHNTKGNALKGKLAFFKTHSKSVPSKIVVLIIYLHHPLCRANVTQLDSSHPKVNNDIYMFIFDPEIALLKVFVSQVSKQNYRGSLILIRRETWSICCRSCPQHTHKCLPLPLGRS